MSSLPLHITTDEGLCLTVKKGCITAEQVDVIINSTTANLQLNAGTLSKCILWKAGHKIQEECRQKSPQGITRGHVVDTSAGMLPAQCIYHGSLSPWLNGNGEADLLAFVRCFLDKADTEAKTSMAIPAITTGVLAFPAKVVATLMHKEIVKFSRARPNTILKDVRIVLYSDPQLTDFLSVFGCIIRESHAQRTPFPSCNTVYTAMALSPVQPSFNVLPLLGLGPQADQYVANHRKLPAHHYSGNIASVNTKNGIHIKITTGNIIEAQTAILVNVTGKDLRLGHGAISAAILRAAGKTIQGECARNAPYGIEYGEIVRTSGGRLNCGTIFHTAVKKWSANSGEKRLRAVIENILENAAIDGHSSVAMPSVGSGQILQYPVDVMAACMLEAIDNFSEANPSTSVTEVVIVVYEGDTETLRAFENCVHSKYSTDTSNVAMRNQATGTQLGMQLPPTWSPMPGSQLFLKEVLHSQSTEYQDISKRFTDTGGPGNVHKIERIQCMKLYQLYTVLRQQMEQTLSRKYNVEEILFHGTSQDVLDKINRQGFNRAFSAKNGTSLGEGTYFAKDASHSCCDTYSPRDNNGYKHVYQCRVLTGEYTCGTAGLKEPPAKRSGDSTILFDSVVNDQRNPTVFVVFHDAQAYPEYLITFS